MANRIRQIMIQKSARLDSLTALYLLYNVPQAESLYPGVSKAKIVSWGTGTFGKDGKTWQEYLKEGTLLIGVGGGPLDEHPSPEYGDRKKAGDSSTSLVAKHLGIDGDPRYKLLIETVTKADLEGSAPDTLASRVKALHRQGYDATKIANMIHPLIHTIVVDQIQLTTAIEMVENAEVRNVRGQRIALVQGDNYMISMAARRVGIAVIIQIRKSGHALIFTDKKVNPDMRTVAEAIRYREMWAREQGDIAEPMASEKLRQPGQLEECPCWCYQMPGSALLNGSETAPEIEPTKLSAQELLEIVCKHVRFGTGSVAPQNRQPAMTTRQ